MLIYFTHLELRASFNLKLIRVTAHSHSHSHKHADGKETENKRHFEMEGTESFASKFAKVKAISAAVCCIWQQLSTKSFTEHFPFGGWLQRSGKLQHTIYLSFLFASQHTHTHTHIQQFTIPFPFAMNSTSYIQILTHTLFILLFRIPRAEQQNTEHHIHVCTKRPTTSFCHSHILLCACK